MILETAAVGIAVILAEGASAQTVTSADVVCTSVLETLSLFDHPLRLVATTLRSQDNISGIRSIDRLQGENGKPFGPDD